MDDSTTELLGLMAIVIGLAAAYAKAFGGYQTQIVAWVVDAFQVGRRRRGLANLAVGVPIALAFSAFGAWKLGDWSLLAMGLLAGFLASVEAGKVHDAEQEVAAQEHDRREEEKVPDWR